MSTLLSLSSQTAPEQYHGDLWDFLRLGALAVWLAQVSCEPRVVLKTKSSPKSCRWSAPSSTQTASGPRSMESVLLKLLLRPR